MDLHGCYQHAVCGELVTVVLVWLCFEIFISTESQRESLWQCSSRKQGVKVCYLLGGGKLCLCVKGKGWRRRMYIFYLCLIIFFPLPLFIHVHSFSCRKVQSKKGESLYVKCVTGVFRWLRSHCPPLCPLFILDYNYSCCHEYALIGASLSEPHIISKAVCELFIMFGTSVTRCTTLYSLYSGHAHRYRVGKF